MIVTGTYYIRASTFAEDTLSDSFYAQVDGAPEAGYLWDIFPAASYVIDYINDRFFADPVELQLTPGQHIVRFYRHEDGARLDTVELILTTDNPGPVPTCAGMKQEAEDGAFRGQYLRSVTMLQPVAVATFTFQRGLGTIGMVPTRCKVPNTVLMCPQLASTALTQRFMRRIY